MLLLYLFFNMKNLGNKSKTARKKKVKTIKSDRKKEKKNFINWLKEHRAIIIISVIIIMILVTSGTKVFLYLNFIVGNDIIIHLDADKEDLNLVRGGEESVNFKASVITNPFCAAECESSFEDISNNKTIDYDSFKLTPGMPITKEYKIRVDDFGEGQKLYRFRLECIGSASFLCHTKGESTSRSILVTVEYNLTEDEKILKDDLKNKLINLKERLSDLATNANEVDLVINELDKGVSIDETKKEFDNAEKEISKLIENLNVLKKIWGNQDYYELNKKFKDIDIESIKTADLIIKIDKNISDSIFLYNNLANELNETRERLKEIMKFLVLDENLALEINDNIKVFNSVINSFKLRNEISKKRIEVYSINYSVDKLHESIKSYERGETLKRSIEVDINYDILCRLNQTCVKRPSISERANQTEFELKNACDEIEQLKVIYLNISKNNYANRSTDAIKKDIAENYLNELPEDGYNNEIIKEILLAYATNSTEGIYDINSTEEIVEQIIKDQPESCQKPNITYYDLNNESIELIKEEETMPVKIGIEFDEPFPKCCVFGKCSVCCLSEECVNDPSKFPVVFVHGHSVNKNTAADYSLDVFNKLQKELEKDGYLNAGSISLYTPVDTSPGVWGLSQAPVSIKASYYFDVFKEPENYVVVQTKSENIDTYALRLREIIQTIKYRTGKPRVVIIAHSMGGLVSRRYLQIFGEDDVEKLIMIGTPNKGIEGGIASFCPIVGSELACRDMKKDSLFINKLNSGKLPEIPIYNIIGNGCPIDGEPADGTVQVKNVLLEGENVNNIFVNGTCNGLEKLHSKMLDTNEYPEVYDIIIRALTIKQS
ncbi:MAG: alpha/beta fold hydrolase [Nanoarchaeota archaeon]|nr:alpha/beta fold hydrolase [Nanoarchaeota archaeon]